MLRVVVPFVIIAVLTLHIWLDKVVYKSCYRYKPKQTLLHFNKKTYLLTHIRLEPPLFSPCCYIQVLCNKTKHIGNIINLKNKVNWYGR